MYLRGNLILSLNLNCTVAWYARVVDILYVSTLY